MLFRSPAYPGLRLRSLPRLYPAGVNLVTEGREDLLYIRIQNRGSNNVHFWHGLVPSGPAGDGPDLPLDPAEWTTQQQTDAATLISEYGERIGAGVIWEPTCAHTGPLYSYVQSSPNKSHVMVGFQSDQEQGVGGHKEKGT